MLRGTSIDDVGAEFHALEIVEGLSVISIIGSADYWAAPAMQDALTRAEAASPRGLIICLDQATYFGAAAFTVLNAISERAAATGSRPVVVVCPRAHIACRVLRLLHFEGPRVDTLAAALLMVRCVPSPNVTTLRLRTQPRASAS